MSNKNTKRQRRENPKTHQKRKSTKPKVAADGGEGMTMDEQHRMFYGNRK